MKNMKKRLVLVMCVLLVCAVPASAQGWMNEDELPWWCMTEYEDTLLTLTFPTENALEYAWYIEISDGEILEMLFSQTLGDEPDESDEPLWIASFAAVGRKSGPVTLRVTQMWGDVSVQTCQMELEVTMQGRIRVRSAVLMDPEYKQELYYLQAGAFAVRENAENQLQLLTQRGFEGIIKLSDGLYKVQAGAFALEENAKARLEALHEAGFSDAYITRNLKGEIVAGADIFHPPFFLYTVCEGDTLWGLARSFLGDGRRWTEISELNEGCTKIYEGQTLLLPR